MYPLSYFSMYINDLEEYLASKNGNIFTIESVGCLQQIVKEFYTYCTQWKISVTGDKTKTLF